LYDENPSCSAYGSIMGPKVQVLATRVGSARAGRLVYTAQVVDPDAGVDTAPLWKCEHDHEDPQTAYACAIDWTAKSAIHEGGPSVPYGARPEGGSPQTKAS
jgi:hypothetical protein